MTDLTSALTSPASYPWAPDLVQRVDTHLSRVFLAGERVLKIKRAVDYGFVDFRSLETRRQSCEDECRLNRRLTSDVYLGVVPITLADEAIQVDGAGDIVEWGTVMRRLPAEGMLDELSGMVTSRPISGRALGSVWSRFTSRSRVHATDDPNMNWVRRYRWSSRILMSSPRFAGPFLDKDQFDLVAASIHSYIAGNRANLDRRVADGWIREGHGDLRAEHICLEPDGDIQIFDCVEFSKNIRCADVASDLAFLLMDLRRLDGWT